MTKLTKNIKRVTKEQMFLQKNYLWFNATNEYLGIDS